ncbi:hypothetical protein TruAng_003227 [Truncatella angustata]|nr:hypothetical protein TruAng_003227 [Truncatella angustata]
MIIPDGLRLNGTSFSPRGRFLTAGRTFEPGELIAHFTTPSIALPDSPSLSLTCSYCLRTDTTVRACTGCRGTYYCSAPCQKADWGLVHKAECKVFKRVKSEGHDFLPTPVRALLHVLLRADMRNAASELEGHVEAFRKDGGEWKNAELQAMGALHYLELEMTQKRISEAVELGCKLRVNSFNRKDEDIGQTGVFVNPALAMLNHSCVPNAFVQFSGRKAILRANITIEEGQEVVISYINSSLYRCSDDLDVYQVAKIYPDGKLNNLSLKPDLELSDKPAIATSVKSIHTQIDKIYAAVSSDPPVELAAIRKHWQLCGPLRKANLFAIEPLPQTMAGASIYFVKLGNFPFSLAVSCFLAVHIDPFTNPMPFGPSRIKGLQMVANLLSNTGPMSGSETPSSDNSLNGRVAQALSKMDQATIAQAVLAIIAHWAPFAHSKEWQIYRDASMQLNDIEDLPGRGKERDLVKLWVTTPDDVEAAMFFDYAVLKPVRKLAGFALEIMDAEFSGKQGLLGDR